MDRNSEPMAAGDRRRVPLRRGRLPEGITLAWNVEGRVTLVDGILALAVLAGLASVAKAPEAS